MRAQHSCSTFRGLSNRKIKTLPIFPLIGTHVDIQRAWSRASVHTLQIACYNFPSALFIFAVALTIEHYIDTQTKKAQTQMKPLWSSLCKPYASVSACKSWQSCHHRIINCYYSISSQSVKEVEKLLLVSNWTTWSKTSSLWGCSSCGRSLALDGNTETFFREW